MYKFLGKLGDILLIPIVIFALSSCVLMLVQRTKNKPISFLGNSLVYVMSESMTSEGLLKGDTLFVRKASTQEIDLKDVIAFYYYSDKADTINSTKHLVKKFPYSSGLYVDMSEEKIEYGVNISDYPKVERPGLKTIEDAQKAKASIYFHRVIGIYVDDYGNIFYQTKGSDNASADQLVRSDFVLGKYVNTPREVRDAMTFFGSARGMIIMVCIPLSIMVLFQCLSLIKQIELIGYERNLIKGKKRFDDEDVQKTFNGNDMELYNKVYLYYLSSSEDREKVKNFMWGNLLITKKPSKSEKKEIETLAIAEEKLKFSKRQYWQQWIENTKGYDRKRIKKYYEELAIKDVLKSNVQKSEVSPVEKNTKDSLGVNAGDTTIVDMDAQINKIVEHENAKKSVVNNGLGKSKKEERTAVSLDNQKNIKSVSQKTELKRSRVDAKTTLTPVQGDSELIDDINKKNMANAETKSLKPRSKIKEKQTQLGEKTSSIKTVGGIAKKADASKNINDKQLEDLTNKKSSDVKKPRAKSTSKVKEVAKKQEGDNKSRMTAVQDTAPIKNAKGTQEKKKPASKLENGKNLKDENKPNVAKKITKQNDDIDKQVEKKNAVVGKIKETGMKKSSAKSVKILEQNKKTTDEVKVTKRKITKK